MSLPADPSPPPRPPLRFLAALLSFAVPGLGQIVQGAVSGNRQRLAKGVFFLVSLLGMFMYGQWLGDWRVVYLPHFQEAMIKDDPRKALRWPWPWPPDKSLMSPFAGDLRTRLPYVAQFWAGAAAWPALWNYFLPDLPLFGGYQASPGAVKAGENKSARELLAEADQADSDEQFAPGVGRIADLAWMYTVIAGVMNLLVIYDAWAGPVRRVPAPKEEKK